MGVIREHGNFISAEIPAMHNNFNIINILSSEFGQANTFVS